MRELLQFAVIGLSTGAVYAVLGSSLVSLYAATGIVNFAQGSVALWAVWQTAALQANGTLVLPVGAVHLGSGPMSTWPAVGIGAASGLLWSLAAHFLVFRPLRRAPALGQVVASVGVMLVIQALVPLRFDQATLGTDPGALVPVADLTAKTVTIGGAVLAVSNLILAALAAAVAAGLAAYFRFTRLGIATRAGAEDEQALRLMGYSPDRLAALVWGVTGFASGLTVILAAPAIGGLDPAGYMLYVVPALAVALVGRLTSIGVACLSGLALGSLQQILLYLTTKTWWPSWAQAGVADAIPFLVVVAALFLRGRGIPERGARDTTTLPPVRIPKPRPLVTAALVVGAGGAIAATSGQWRFSLVMSIILMLIAASVVLLTGYLGQISLTTMAFAGAAGFALSKLTMGAHVPFPLSILLAALVATALGVVVGVPALRIRGAQLAVATIAAALAIQSFVFNNPALTPYGGDLIRDPSLFGYSLAVRRGTDVITLRFSYMVLAVVAVLMVAAMRLLTGATGRAFLAVRSNERAAASAGVNVPAVKLLGFALSSFLAGVGGCLIGYSRGQLSAASFTVLVGLAVLATTYVGGITRLSGAVLAGLAGPLGVVYLLLTQTFDLGKYYTLVVALAMVAVVVLGPPRRLSPAWPRLGPARSGAAREESAAAPDPADASETAHAG